MAYADPQSVVVGANTTSMPRTGQSENSGNFRSPDRRYRLSVAHESGKRERHIARLEFSDVVSNPLVPSQNSAVAAAVTFTINAPLNGMSFDQVGDLSKALVAWLTPANLARLVGGES